MEILVVLTDQPIGRLFPYRISKPVLEQGLACEATAVAHNRFVYCFRDLLHDGPHAANDDGVEVLPDERLLNIVQWP